MHKTSTNSKDVTALPPAQEPLSPLTEFTLFPELPIELRLKIFKYALPIGSQGLRMLKVTADRIVTNCTTKATIKSKSQRSPNESKFRRGKKTTSYLTFQLLNHHHNGRIKDLALLSACSESRGVYLKCFTQSLRTDKDRLIRFAKDDIVCIANMDYLIDSDEFLNALRDNSVFESILLQKLAFPKFWFLAAWSLYWLPSQGSVVPQSVLQRGGGEVLSMITQCKALNGEKRVRRQWEACEALRGQKIPELCVWDMDGNQVIHGKTEDRTQSAT